MRNCFWSLVLVVAAVGAVSAPARADFMYSEGPNPELSGDGLSPTFVGTAGPGVGVNTVRGFVGRGDRDYFTVQIPVGFQFDALFLTEYETDAPTLVAFIGVQAGSQVTLPPNPPNAVGLLGWHHFNQDDLNTDILPDIGMGGAGATGFTPPLPSGLYSFWVQETGNLTVTYQFDFRITAVQPTVVPEPASLTLAGLGALLGLGYATRRGRSKAASSP